MALETSRPAFYALRSGGWRDYVTLLHPPYTAWHLSYVAIGAALSAQFSWSRLLPTLVAFFLAVGIGAHALDELNGRPLRTTIPQQVLVALAASSIGGAAAIGIFASFAYSLWLLVFVAAGVLLVVAYNLELFGGRLHTDVWFGIAWGGFPVLTAYFTQAERIRVEAVLAAAFAVLLSLAQRTLSTTARSIRRDVRSVTGAIERTDGTSEAITVPSLLAPAEAALRALTAATVVLAAALLVLRLA